MQQQCTNPAGNGYVTPSNPKFFPQDLSGRDIPRTPRHKATVYAYYGINLGQYGYLYPGGNFSFQTGQFANAFNSSRFYIPRRTLVGLTLTYRTPGERLDVTTTVSNVFGNNYFDSVAVSAFGSAQTATTASYGAQRFFSVIARYRF